MIQPSTLKTSDKASVIELLQDVEVMRFLGPRRALNNDEAEQWFEQELNEPTRLVFRNQHHQLVGFCGIKIIDGKLDFGYFLRRSFWKKGYGTKMCQMSIEHYKNNIDFSKVNVFIANDNTASQKIAQKLNWIKLTSSVNEFEKGYLYQITV